MCARLLNVPTRQSNTHPRRAEIRAGKRQLNTSVEREGDGRGPSFSSFAEGGMGGSSGYASGGAAAPATNVHFGAGAGGLDADTALLAEKDAAIAGASAAQRARARTA